MGKKIGEEEYWEKWKKTKTALYLSLKDEYF